MSHTPIGVRQLNNWLPYFGYNLNGVYVCAYENSGTNDSHFYFDREHLGHMSYFVDQLCAECALGYIMDWWWWLSTVGKLFGKARSGLAVCRGNPRSSH